MLGAKQEARLEKKKKKLAALNEIIKLNDVDRKKKNDSSAINDENSDNASSSSNDQPSPKRVKKTEEITLAVPAQEISYEKYSQMKKTLTERKRNERFPPKIRLRLGGESALLSVESNLRTPIFLTDIQHLIMVSVLGSGSPCIPSRWCHMDKASKISHTVVVILEGFSLYNFTANESLFKNSSKLFAHKLEVVMPRNGQTVEELMTVSLTHCQQDELIEKYGSLEAAIESTRNQAFLMDRVFPVEEKESSKAVAVVHAASEIIPRTQLLLSALQLVDEDYPLPLRGDLANRYKDYVMTNDCYAPVTSTSPMFGLDCEMCRTSAGINELTRISIINEQFENVYETLVKPDSKIIDYLTVYSGITEQLMENVTKTLKQVQQEVRALLPADAILVGQSLNCDLVAMKMMHPYIIDTSVIYNVSGDRRTKSKLQTLSMEFLGEAIQMNRLGHDSIEDCSASLKLTKLKLSKGVDFGDAILAGRKRAMHLDKIAGGDAIPNELSSKKKKKTAIISSAETEIDYSKFIQAVDSLRTQKNINCVVAESNKHAILKTRELAIQNDLTITHLKIGAERLEEANIKKTISKIDRWITNCWESIAPNALFTVIFSDASTGDGKNTNGIIDPVADIDTGEGTAQILNYSGVVMMDVKRQQSFSVEERKQ